MNRRSIFSSLRFAFISSGKNGSKKGNTNAKKQNRFHENVLPCMYSTFYNYSLFFFVVNVKWYIIFTFYGQFFSAITWVNSF